MKRFAVIFLLLLPTSLFAQGKGYKPLTPERRAILSAESDAAHGGRIPMLAKNQIIPSSFDANDKVPLSIWDQGNCGSCYEVSTVRTATCALIRLGYGKPDGSFLLAAQYGMDRPRNFGGCDGGNGTEVIAWMIKNGWVCEQYIDSAGVVHKDYPPYEARSGSDRTKAGAKVWMKDGTWGFVNSNGKPTILEIKTAIYNFGRLNIAIDAGGQFSNGSGTITSLGNNIDHEINARAFDDTKAVVQIVGDPMGKLGLPKQVGMGAFLLENQWGDGWGSNGCRWCSYAASVHIVDWFFVTGGPLPPPPPPPPPPPVDGATIILSKDLKAGTYELHPAGTKSKLDAIRKILDETEPPVVQPPKEMPPAKDCCDPPKSESKLMIEKLEKELADLQKAVADRNKSVEARKNPVHVPASPPIIQRAAIVYDCPQGQ